MVTQNQKKQTLRPSRPETEERNSVRLGGGVITAEFPSIERPDPAVAERGAVRLGGGVITAGFPL